MFGNASEMNDLASKENISNESLPKVASTNLLTELAPEIRKIALEYAKLASQSNLSEAEADRLGAILASAVEDEVINFWLTEIDHLLGHALGFLEDKMRQSYEDQQALLREYCGDKILRLPISDELKQRNGKTTPIHGGYSVAEY